MQFYSVKDFCERAGISRGLFYKMVREGTGPRVIKAGRRTLVSEDAAAEWRNRLERDTLTEPRGPKPAADSSEAAGAGISAERVLP